MPTETSFGVGAKKRSVRTAHTVVYGTDSVTTGFEVTNGNVKTSLSFPASPSSGTITLTYILTNPRASSASIQMEYSTDGVVFSTGTSAGGDDGTSPLTTSANGTSHTFKWDTVTDLGIDFKETVFIRIKAFDLPGQLGDTESSELHKIIVDNSPLAPTIVSPTEGFFSKDETQTFTFIIPNPNQGNSNLHFKIDIDAVNTFDSNVLKVFESRLDQTGWEYDSDGAGSWVNIPHNGVPIITTPALIGNQARFTVQTTDKLSGGKLFWKVVAGGITS